MYFCNNCKSTFDEPLEQLEERGYYGSELAYEKFYVCPHCNESSYDEAENCQLCTGYAFLGENFCEDCKEDLIKKFHDTFTKDEREFLITEEEI